MTGLVPRAVIIGALVDNAGTIIVGELFRALVGMSTGATSPEDFATVMEGSVPLLLIGLALGLLFTLIGGFVGAMLAKGNERTNAFGVGIISTVVGFLLTFSAPEGAPFWVEAAGLLLTIPAALLGGEARLAVVRMKRP
jgi:hypothetical protein